MSRRTTCAGGQVSYFVRAALIRREIEAVALATAHHPYVQGIQNIFCENAHRLGRWIEDPRVPAENNNVPQNSSGEPPAVRVPSLNPAALL
jgi:hypothetical protein